MKKDQVQVGGRYHAKVSGSVVEVRITGERWVGDDHRGWNAVNTATNRPVVIKSAQRLRAEVAAAEGAKAEAPAAGPAVAPPNFMAFCCSLDRAEKAARGDAARLGRVRELRGQAVAKYKAKDYAGAVALHDEAHRAATAPQAGPEAAAAPKANPAPPDAPAAPVAPATAVRAVKVIGAKPASVAPLADAGTVVAAAGSPRPPKAKDKKAGKAPKAKADKPKRMSGLDAVAKVLQGAGKPMSAKEMVEEAFKRGLWKSAGKTPEATIYAAIIRDIAARGRESRFRKTGRGQFAAAGKAA